jgi:hypothetical protein
VPVVRLPSRRTFGSAVRGLTAACALAALACLCSCNLFRGGSAKSESEQVVTKGEANAPKMTEVELLREVQRNCESYMSELNQAANDLVQHAGTPEAMLAAQRWKVGQSTSAMAVATGPRATSNLLDFVVLATLASYAQQDYWRPTYGEAADQLLEVHRMFEEKAWNLAHAVLGDEQQANLRTALDEWRVQNRDQQFTAFLRIPAFADIAKGASTGDPNKNMIGQLLKMVNVDPFSGLDPATREIERSRMFAERALFYAQRAPLLLSMQVELTTMEIGQLPGVQEALDATVKISDAVHQIGEAAKLLPETIEAQRHGLVTDLEASQPTLEKLLADTRTTLDQAHELSESLDKLTHSVDGFVGQFRGEPSAPPAPAAPGAQPGPEEGVALAASSEPRKPFDIRDYGATAREVTETTKELNQLVANIDQTLPELQRVLDDTEARGTRLVDRAFWRAVLLIALLLGGGLLVTLAIVSAARRRPERSEPAREPTPERR